MRLHTINEGYQMELEMPDWTCRAVRLAWLREEGVSTTFSSFKF